MKLLVRHVLAIGAAILAGQILYIALFFAVMPFLAWYERQYPPTEYSVGVTPLIGWAAFIILPLMASALAGLLAARVSRSSNPAFAVATGLALGLYLYALLTRLRGHWGFVGLCALVSLTGLVACFAAQTVRRRNRASPSSEAPR